MVISNLRIIPDKKLKTITTDKTIRRYYHKVICQIVVSFFYINVYWFAIIYDIKIFVQKSF